MNMISEIGSGTEVDWVPSVPTNQAEVTSSDVNATASIDSVLARLDVIGHGREYAVLWVLAMEAIGGHVDVEVMPNGHESLRSGHLLDAQEHERRRRFNALVDHVLADASRRQAVIDLLNDRGEFFDRRPYADAEEAACAIVESAGRIHLLADGRCEVRFPDGVDRAVEAGSARLKRRRALQRYAATIRFQSARDRLAAHVRERGRRHAPSGSYVLDHRSLREG